jgi:hypothetical protein
MDNVKVKLRIFIGWPEDLFQKNIYMYLFIYRDMLFAQQLQSNVDVSIIFLKNKKIWKMKEKCLMHNICTPRLIGGTMHVGSINESWCANGVQ